MAVLIILCALQNRTRAVFMTYSHWHKNRRDCYVQQIQVQYYAEHI